MSWLPTVSFVLILLMGSAAVILSPTKLPQLQEHDLIKGEWSATLEQDFDKTLPFHQAAIDTWGVIEYGLFKDGRPGVLVGKEGWLFTDEEFQFLTGEKAEIQAKVTFIAEIKARLEARGIDLVIALIPAKARVYREHLGRYTLPTHAKNRYHAFRQELLALGVNTPDLLTPLLEAKSQEPVFLRTDTHWRPFGARVVAKELAAVSQRVGNTPFTSQTFDAREHVGDLMNFIPLGSWQGRLGPAPDLLRQETTLGQETATSLGLFETISVPITLVGTSYSANPLWNFAGALQQELGADVLNAAQEGRGPMLPMLDYLENDAFRESPPEVVIWEIPERYLPIHYDLKRSEANG
jgi:alginate O-acetyltransferase complex protein AlgJ